jgi:uncharacterized membrane protein
VKPPSASAIRVAAIDILRGLVMVLMALDHASETFNAGRLFGDSTYWYKPGSPLPLDQFLTRWLTHLCAPTFVTLAGVALAISTEGRRRRGQSESQIDRHIVLRGLLLVAFDVVWMSPIMLEAWAQFLFQVLYALGASLVCMALLRRLSDRALAGLGVVLLVGGEILLGAASRSGLARALPVVLTLSPGELFDRRLIVGYPLLPWLALMCLGWAFGRRLVGWRAEGKDAAREGSRLLAIAGAVLLAVFVVLRGLNGFGNMGLLREDGSLAHWLHVSKYPPSLTFVGLEVGVGALLLSGLMALEARSALPRVLEPLRLLGGTALFFYLLHLHVLSLVAILTGTRHALGLGAAYGGALGVVLVLYPLCAWYRRYKTRNPDGWARWI